MLVELASLPFLASINKSGNWHYFWYQIFNTPDGTLSTQQGVYIAEVIADKNVKHSKGRFKMYDDDDDGQVC